MTKETKDHFAQYGNILIKRIYCSHCQEYAFVIDNYFQCCDKICNIDDVHEIEVVISPKYNKQRKRIPFAVKKNILDIQNNKCYYCEKTLGYSYFRNNIKHKSTIHFDHIVPFEYCKIDKYENIVASCNLCNSCKSSKMFNNMDELKDYISLRIKAKKIEIIE